MASARPEDRTPKSAGFSVPAEWAPHESVWLAWPSHADLWQENLTRAQAEFTELCRAIADVDPNTGRAQGETLNVLVPEARAGAQAERALAGLPVRLHMIPFGDIWLRDTAPVFVRDVSGEVAPVRLRFNGWGGKYVLPHDDRVSTAVARASAATQTFAFDAVMEGGSVEFDGEGTCLTSRQCLLNPNRNPGMSQDEIEALLSKAFGVQRTLWLGDGLLNDHTDGHIDTIARFAAPGVALCMEPAGSDDPNKEVMLQIARDLESMIDARGRRLRVMRIPSPGRVVDDEERTMPASYLNFYIANSTVVVPIYGAPNDSAAVRAIGACFPGRRTVGLSARAIISGGGAFHCITQQVPARGESK